MTNASDTLLSSLWRASWQGALTLLFVWLLCRLLAGRLSADTHCWLWRLAYAKLLIGLLWGGAIFVPLLAPAPPFPSAAPSSVVSTSQANPVPKATAPAAAPEHLAAPVYAPGAPLRGWRVALAAAYAMGVAVCLGRLLLAARRTRRILRSAVAFPAGPETECADELAGRMDLRRVPPVAHSALVNSPVLVAGQILLPADAQYSPEEMRMILAHEFAHVRRRDLLWEWLGTLVQVVFFFHPLVLLARREERLVREAAADAVALHITQAPAADYGRLLLSLALGQGHQHPTLAGSVGVIEGGSPLRRRLLALRDAASPPATRRNLWRIAITLVPLMALVFVPWRVTHGQAKPPVAPPASTPPAYPAVPVGNKRITGVVRDQAGTPVAGISVGLGWVTKTQFIDAGQAVTDPHGRFAFSHLPAGGFECQVSSEDGLNSAGQYVPLTLAQDVAVTLGDSDVEKDLSVVVTPGVLVRGRVVDEQTGKPVAGASVIAGSVPSGSDPADWAVWPGASNGTTDAQGIYKVRVMPGNVFVRVEQTSGGPLMSERVRPAARTVRVRLGQVASAPDIPVSFDPIIVFTGPTGQPVANTPVLITSSNMAQGSPMIDDRTDGTGTVVLSYFEGGTFRTSQNGLYASGTYQWSPGRPLVIQTDGQTLNFPDGVGRVQMTAEETAVVVGHVVSEDEAPIPNALVTVYETDPKSHYGLGNHQFRTDASGNFRAPLDPNGQYQASVRADGFNQVMVSKTPLALTKGVPTDLGTIHLVHATGTVSGRIVDQAGRPMPGILASVDGEQTGNSAALTDSQGRFRIPNVVPGEPLHLTLCLKGELVDGDSGNAGFQSNEQMDLNGVQASPMERQFVWSPHSGGY